MTTSTIWCSNANHLAQYLSKTKWFSVAPSLQSTNITMYLKRKLRRVARASGLRKAEKRKTLPSYSSSNSRNTSD
jgi:hypothetical protein